MQNDIDSVIIEASKRSLIAFAMLQQKEYIPNWHHRLIAKKLEEVLNGNIKRLMIFCPPRHGKTELTTKNFPAWSMGKKEKISVIAACYSGDLAQSFGSETRDKVNNNNYKAVFDKELRKDAKNKTDWKLDDNSSFLAVGVGGAITGKGANLLIIDDPIKNSEEAESIVMRNKVYDWYRTTAYTRLEKDAAVVIILTRWHLDDLAGRLLQEMENGGEQWDIVNLPAIAEKNLQLCKYDKREYASGEPLWESKYDLNALEEIKRTVGIYNWYSLYQQTPVATANQEFKKEWFKTITRKEVNQKKTRNFLTIDTDSFDSNTECDIGICENYVDVDGNWNFACYGKKMNPGAFIQWLFFIHEQYRFEKIGIEKMMATKVLKYFLDEEMRSRGVFLPIQALEHKGTSKDIRIKAGLVPRYTSGSIYHLENECGEYETELLTFPKSRTRDRMDAAQYQTQIAEKPFPNNHSLEEQSYFASDNSYSALADYDWNK